MCPKCSKKDKFPTQITNVKKINGKKYELHICPICGEMYLARTFGYYSILRFHGDNFQEQLDSILEITPKHCESFIQQVQECITTEQLLKVVSSMHGEGIEPKSNAEYDEMLDTSLILTEDIKELIEEV